MKPTGLFLSALVLLGSTGGVQAVESTQNSFILEVKKRVAVDGPIQGGAVNNPVQPVMQNLESKEQFSLGNLNMDYPPGQCDLNLQTTSDFTLSNNQGQAIARYLLVLLTDSGEIELNSNADLANQAIDCSSVHELMFKGVEFFPDAPAGSYQDVIQLGVTLEG